LQSSIWVLVASSPEKSLQTVRFLAPLFELAVPRWTQSWPQFVGGPRHAHALS
jgi:hypothetical protein